MSRRDVEHAEQAAIPIVGHLDFDIDKTDRQRLRRLADQLLNEEPGLSLTEPFGPSVSAGLGPGALAVIEDHGAIQRVGPHADLLYGHRALALAGDGDIVILAEGPNRAFTDYYRDVLKLGEIVFLSPSPTLVPRQLSLRCAEDGAVTAALSDLACRRGGLTIMPYMGTGGAWRLASAVAAGSGVAVQVAAPPPNLTQRVNDKLWFARLVGSVLGLNAAPPYFGAYGPASLVACIRRLARDHHSVAVKLPSSASGLGNAVLTSQEVLDTSPKDLAARLVDLLHLDRGAASFPVMACAWKHTILATPSVQTWVPAADDGDPVIEGVFDQVLSGRRGTFTGAAPADLDATWTQHLGREAMSIALLLQHLGYFGRCSFDAILVDGGAQGAQAYWIECNGRWGGVSLPMTLMNRLTGDWIDHPFVIVETRTELGETRSFLDVLQSLGDTLFRPGRNDAGIVFLSPARLELGIGIDALALDRTIESAQERADRLVDLLSVDQA